jgi:hypothetical protein
MTSDNTDVESINHAFIRMSRRAESVDREKLVQTFVDIGPLFNVLLSNDQRAEKLARVGLGEVKSC